MRDTKKLLCFAHRGASGHEPENTLSAIMKAIELGADWVEVDVYAVEGEVIVIHDERLERTTNGMGYVREKPLAYLRSLDAGKGERIPTLREVLECIDRRAGINIELKGPHTAYPVVSLINEYIDSHGWSYDQVLVSSFSRRQLVEVKKKDPRIRLGVIVDGIRRRYSRFARTYNLYSVHPHIELVNVKFIQRAREIGLKIFVFTVNTSEEIERFERMGVDGIFTDFPDLLTKRS